MHYTESRNGREVNERHNPGSTMLLKSKTDEDYGTRPVSRHPKAWVGAGSKTPGL